VNVSARTETAPLRGFVLDFTVTEDGKAQQIRVFEFRWKKHPWLRLAHPRPQRTPYLQLQNHRPGQLAR
jgi:hypothetical protein